MSTITLLNKHTVGRKFKHGLSLLLLAEALAVGKIGYDMHTLDERIANDKVQMLQESAQKAKAAIDAENSVHIAIELGGYVGAWKTLDTNYNNISAEKFIGYYKTIAEMHPDSVIKTLDNYSDEAKPKKIRQIYIDQDGLGVKVTDLSKLEIESIMASVHRRIIAGRSDSVFARMSKISDYSWDIRNAFEFYSDMNKNHENRFVSYKNSDKGELSDLFKEELSILNGIFKYDDAEYCARNIDHVLGMFQSVDKANGAYYNSQILEAAAKTMIKFAKSHDKAQDNIDLLKNIYAASKEVGYEIKSVNIEKTIMQYLIDG